MEEYQLEVHQEVSRLKDLLDQVKAHLGDRDVKSSIRDGFKIFNDNLKWYNSSCEQGSIEVVSSNASKVAQIAKAVADVVTDEFSEDKKLKNFSQLLSSCAIDLLNYIDSSPIRLSPLEDDDVQVLPLESLKKSISDNPQNIFGKSADKYEKIFTATENRINELNKSIDSINNAVAKEIDQAQALYVEALSDVQEKQSQINGILGHVSGRAIAGDFEKSAEQEKSMADTLRIVSLVLMFFIVMIVGYSFWATVSAEFKWENSLFRVFLAMILSVPAAYLARESAKHREQQYNHLQTSLDLKAITPYLASLPEQEQHRIKAEIANRIFAGRDFSRVGSDTLPVNIHEILMELIKKLDVKR